MTYDVKINLKKHEVLPDVFDWINAQGWNHIVEWRWFKRHAVNDDHYIFQFDDKTQAEWFSLRWL